MNPLWTLAPLSVLAGALMMAVFRRTTGREAIRQAANRIQAHLLEFWLFVDEPALVWKSWKRLLEAQFMLLRRLLPPLVILTIPMIPAFYWLDAVYGHSPLSPGRAALVTIGMNRSLDTPPLLTAPAGIAVESPPVRVFAAREVSWRIRAERALSGMLELRDGAATVRKSIRAGSGVAYLPTRRSQSVFDLVRYPGQAPLGPGAVAWIDVSYPSARVSLFCLNAHWSVWFIVFSTLGAIVFGRI